MGKQTLFRLSDSTYIEPLINCWSVWAHLIPPVPASLHLVRYQLEALESYLLKPDYHFQSARDPKFAGSRFTDIAPERADEVRALLERTRERQRENIKLADAVTEFQNLLADEAEGQCLEPFYEKIPDELRGYVELVYDYYHHPTARFIEPLLYESRYYDTSLQSLRLAQLARDDSRPFFMSTPRLPEREQIDWAIPLADPLCDELFKLDAQPQPLERIREILDLPATEEARLAGFLSEAEQTPQPSEEWTGAGVRIRYYGHACVLVEWQGVSILTDPYIGVMPLQGGISRFSYRDLPQTIDYVLVTHNHQDHLAFETLLRLRHRIGCLVVPKSYGLLYGDISFKLMARKMGFKNVMEMDSLDSIPIPDGSIHAVPFLGEHGDLAHGKAAYVVRAGREQMLFAADSDCLDQRLYEHVRQALGRIETVFLGTESVGAPLSWSCGPLFPRKPPRHYVQTRRFHGSDARAGLRILEALGARRIFNYAMGMEPWLYHLLGLGLSDDSPQIRESNKLIATAREQGFLDAERLFGKREIYLDHPASVRRETVAAPSPLEERLDYWTGRITGALSLPDFAALRPRASKSEPGSGQQPFTISASLCAALNKLSEDEGCTLFTTLLAAFKILLYSHTGQEEITVGTILDHRSLVESRSPLGTLANTLMLTTKVTPEIAFLTFMARVRGTVAGASAYADLPLELLAERLKAKRVETSQLLCPVLFALDEDSSRIRTNDALASSVQAEHGQMPKPELALFLHLETQGLTGILAYDAARFEGGAMRTMLDQYLLLLEEIVAHPERRISELSVSLNDPHEEDDDGPPSFEQMTSDIGDQFIF